MNVISYMKEHLLYLDGGLGTLLQREGLAPGEHPERWSITHPDVLRRIHADYYRAGSNVVSTNTFGANALKFSDAELEEIVRTAIENVAYARDNTEGNAPRFIALDIGPTGKLLRPLGDLEFEEAVSIFAKTVRLGAKYGADLVLIETMNDSLETKAALLAAKENCDLPVFVSNAYGADGKLMTGATPAAMVAMLEGLGADAIGANCSLGPAALRDVVEELLTFASVPVLLKPNAGLPRVESGETVYDIDHDAFAEEMRAAALAGVRVLGGCCGTTPRYIDATVRVTAHLAPVPTLPKTHTMTSSYTHAVVLGNSPVLIGERINPTGKKRFKEALLAHDIGYILKEGIAQQDKGVQVLDVNVGIPEVDEAALLTEAVTELQAIIDLPLQIDTANPEAMARAMRVYNGKPMVNSVNGKRESMEAVFPLVKKYGGLVVALTLDENGIPDTVEGRFEIAKRILDTAATYGIDKKDIVFDTLAMTVSADRCAPRVTLNALSRIKNELGCHTSLGVSNVSFGLPSRDTVNSTFFAMALQSGLSAAIMNPYSTAMMGVYHAYRALVGADASCADFVRFAATIPTPVTAPNAAPAPTQGTSAAAQGAAPYPTGTSELQTAILKGLSRDAASLTAALIATTPPLDVIQNEIVPALDVVGRGFEQKTIYLPQLLMSAEAAGAAFDVIKAHVGTARTADKGRIVLATVKGDIHDIGKNILHLLLENYGFSVTDLGRDVRPEEIVRATKEMGATVVGLSALMTTTVPAMEETIKQLRAALPHCRVMVGGAVLTAEYAARIGADAYAKDAMEGVRIAERFMK